MKFGFLLFDELEELDFVGPWEMVGVWGKHFDGPQNRVTVSQNGGVVTCTNGLRVVADHSFEDCPPLDYLLVPGGRGTVTEMKNTTLLNFIKSQVQSCRHVLSVCTGAFLLAEAGLLHGKRATTYWNSLDYLRTYPDVKVVEERFVRDGNVWTAAGVSAGINLTLALIAAEAGEETAGRVQLGAEYYPSQTVYGTAHQGDNLPAYIQKLAV